MKLIHTSDIHLASPLTTRLPSTKVSERRAELAATFARMIREAELSGADAVIIAGDLFDSEKITAKQLDTALSVIEGSADMSFFYLPGNHERDVLMSKAGTIPKNLHIFDKDWTYFTVGNLTVAGRSETSSDMFDTLDLLPDDKNIVVLHGELRDKSAEGGIVGLRDAAGKNIDYLALGHYHTYSRVQIDRRGAAVYCGAPEGRGFDETGTLGFVEIEVTDVTVTHRFIPFAKRALHIKEVDLTGLLKTSEVEAKIREQIADIPKKDLTRVVLIGERELDLRCDTRFIEEKYKDSFYCFEIKDKSRLSTKPEDYEFDKSLRGEFIRLCLADETLGDAERETVIHCGLSALAGEAFDE